MTKEQILLVEYYDQLNPDKRQAWKDNCDEESDEFWAEIERIDRGLKALCLS